MKLPKEIHGYNKIRDAAICSCWVLDTMSPLEIAIKFRLSEVRILQILRTNKVLLAVDKDWERTKAIIRTKRKIKDSPSTKRDVLDWEMHLQKLLDGGTPLIDNSTHNHVNYTWNNAENDQHNDQVQPSRLPEGNTRGLTQVQSS